MIGFDCASKRQLYKISETHSSPIRSLMNMNFTGQLAILARLLLKISNNNELDFYERKCVLNSAWFQIAEVFKKFITF